MERGAQAGRAARGSPANAALRGLLLSIRDRGRILLPPPPPCPDPPPPAPLRSPERPRAALPPRLPKFGAFLGGSFVVPLRSGAPRSGWLLSRPAPEPAPFPSDPPL